ncbi:MAG: hypothetical protein BWY89_01863 [Bacteroidetes bacterium ADurb.BinA012]|nr:MAG: hypothetical protein BWY89_01863 [Bacteroidetes bacterium ADurb.BinA012]
MPLAMAVVTSLALPRPWPTIPFSSPTTTMAEKLKVRPPLVTFVTLWMLTSLSVSSRSLFFTLFIPYAILIRILSRLRVLRQLMI